MMPKQQGVNPPEVEDESLMLLDNHDYPHSEDDSGHLVSQPRGCFSRFFNRYRLLQIFAWLNYIIAILNIIFNGIIYLDIYEPVYFSTFEAKCHEQVPMVIFLDNFLTIATILFFAFVLRYLKQVALLEGD